MKALALLYHDVVEGGDWDASGFPDPVSATYKFDRHDFERHLRPHPQSRRGAARCTISSKVSWAHRLSS